MAGKSSLRTPAYSRQKRPDGTALAFVKLDGRKVYLGVYGTRDSRKRYGQVIAEWEGAGRRIPVAAECVTVVEVVAAYWAWAESYYRRPDGKEPDALQRIRQAVKPLRELYGSTPAKDFGPLKLRAIRDGWIKARLARKTVNDYTNQLKHLFKWSASMERVPGGVYESLRTVEGLRRGRSDAKETEPIAPVPDQYVEAVKRHVSRQVRTLIDLQLLTGARAGELVIMRPMDLDTTGKVWTYKPVTHKGAWRGHGRVIHLGPNAQNILREFLAGRAVDAFMFDPREAEAERLERRHTARVTPISYGNRPGTNKADDPKRSPADRYTVGSYRRAIHRAGEVAFPVPDGFDDDQAAEWRRTHQWSPHRLRHNAATCLRAEFGIELARAVLGHRLGSGITELYASFDESKAAAAMLQVG